jgi:hypothetical protein
MQVTIMPERNIFRKKPLDKMTSPNDLDELLQVNSSHTWLLFGAIFFMLAGFVIWSFMGSITQNVIGVGRLKIQELPRNIISNSTGQVDAVYYQTGDQIEIGQKLINVLQIDGQTYASLFSPYKGEIICVLVKEGDYLKMGDPVMQILRSTNNSSPIPEVTFFVTEQDVIKLKTGMIAFLEIGKTAIPADLQKYSISYISKYPTPNTTIKNYFENKNYSQNVDEINFEVRASLIADINTLSPSTKEALHFANGSSCRVVIPVSKQTPASFFFNFSKQSN